MGRSAVGTELALEGTQRIDHRLKVSAGHRHRQKMPDAHGKGLLLKPLFAHFCKQANAMRGDKFQEAAEWSGLCRVEGRNLAQQ
jgi:hypothetical protein